MLNELTAPNPRIGEEFVLPLLNELTVLLLEKLPHFTYDPGRSFRAWLRTVTLNRWREHLRRATLPVSGGAPALANVPDPAEAFWEAEYRQHLVGQALQLAQPHFAPATWQLFWETVVNGKSATEAAAEHGATAGAVRVARFRVLTRLRQELAGLLD